jgi:SAM-dependent methyltransferase
MGSLAVLQQGVFVMNRNQSLEAWLSADPYERYMGRWSQQVAPRFLSWLGVVPARRWLDVGCGTGALSNAILECCSPALVVGIDPSEGFLAKAKKRFAERVVLHRATASEIPIEDAAVDATVSALVLNFVPDALAALDEMARVTVNGGTIGAYVWDYGGKMEMIRKFWDTAIDLDPAAANLDEGTRFPLCRPDALLDLFTRAGLAQVQVSGVDIPTVFSNFEEYWHPFLGGQGPAPTYAMGLDEAQRARLRDRILARIALRPDGSIALTARAWLVRGFVSN